MVGHRRWTKTCSSTFELLCFLSFFNKLNAKIHHHEELTIRCVTDIEDGLFLTLSMCPSPAFLALVIF